MGNLQTGPGFLALHSLISAFLVVPVMYVVWVGVAVSLRWRGSSSNFLDYSIVKKRINIIFLPICVAAFAWMIIFVFPGMFAFFGHRGPSIWHRITGIWISAFPTLGMYIVARTVAATTSARLTLKSLVFGMFLASVPLGILGVIMSLGVSEAGASIVLFFIFVGLHALYIELQNREVRP